MLLSRYVLLCSSVLVVCSVKGTRVASCACSCAGRCKDLQDKKDTDHHHVCPQPSSEVNEYKSSRVQVLLTTKSWIR